MPLSLLKLVLGAEPTIVLLVPLMDLASASPPMVNLNEVVFEPSEATLAATSI